MDINAPDFQGYIDDVARQLFETNTDASIDVFVIVAFEPMNSVVYNKLVDAYQKYASPPDELVYAHFNLALLTRVRSSFCMYSRMDTLLNPIKLTLATQLLEAIKKLVDSAKTKEDLNIRVTNALVDLYFPNTEPGDPVERDSVDAYCHERTGIR